MDSFSRNHVIRSTTHRDQSQWDVPGSPVPLPQARDFYQSCPACGRRLLVEGSYFGRPVYCSHCGCEFVARTGSERQTDSGPSVVDELLERVDRVLARCATAHRSHST